MSDIKLISWNVNGLRAVVKKGFVDWLAAEQPDILGLQEIKISHAAREKEAFDFKDYDEYWNSAERAGYSGTGSLVKNSKLKIKNYVVGLGSDGDDSEGRVQTLEFAQFYFVNVYFPNANAELSRLPYRLDFNKKLLKYLKKLEQSKPVVICGDFNVAHQPIDLARPKDNEGSAGFTREERAWIDELIKAGFIDTYRLVNGDKTEYSWWNYRSYARERNIGWRIDYFFISASLKKKVKRAFILGDIFGSDHCPVGLVLEL
jgi:exodeoxyribonuclease-3